MHSTTRLGLNLPDPDDGVNGYPAVSAQQMVILDGTLIFLAPDTISNLPPPSLAGRMFYATDADQWLLDTGAAWQLINIAQILEGTAAGIPPVAPANSGWLYLAHDSTETSADGVYWSSGSAWVQISGPPVAAGILVGARVTHSVAVTTTSTLPWDTPTDNAIGMWSSGDNTKLKVPLGYGGGWQVGVTFDNTGFTSGVEIRMVLNGSEVIGTAVTGGAGTSQVVTAILEVPLAAGDYVQATFTSGGGTSGHTAHLPQFWARRVANA
jgi:hypothetical protein